MLKSLEKNKIGILLMLCASVFACVGQLLWKIGTQGNLYTILIGFVFYGTGAIFMIVAYKFGSLSVLQPLLSMNYIISIFLGSVFLNEAIGTYKIVGIFVIIAGALLIGGGDD